MDNVMNSSSGHVKLGVLRRLGTQESYVPGNKVSLGEAAKMISLPNPVHRCSVCFTNFDTPWWHLYPPGIFVKHLPDVCSVLRTTKSILDKTDKNLYLNGIYLLMGPRNK